MLFFIGYFLFLGFAFCVFAEVFTGFFPTVFSAGSASVSPAS
jgi:hypothetical protein